jgi:cytochrome c-type biogenesis protein
MSIATYLGLYGAGLLTFASPCVLPLLPVYLGLLGGAGVADGDAQRRLRRAGVGFAIGLALVFVAMGMGASLLAGTLAAHRKALVVVAGVAMIGFGLQLAGVLRVRALSGEKRPFLDRVPTPGGFAGGLLFGAAFAIGWTPCVGPILGAALTYAASTSSNAWFAGAQLAGYAAGLATPLVVAAFAAAKIVPLARRLGRHTPALQRAMGVLLVAVGALVASDRIGTMSLGPKSIDVATASSACHGAASACAAHLEDAPVGDKLAGRPRLVEFVSDHCPVCARMAPLVEDLQKRCGANGDLLRVRIEDEHGRALAGRYGIRVVPTFVTVDASGGEVDRYVGEQPAAKLEQVMGEVRGAACPSG